MAPSIRKLIAIPTQIDDTQLRALWNKKLGEGDAKLKQDKHYTQTLFEVYRTDMKFCGVAPFIADLSYLIKRRGLKLNAKDLSDIERHIEKVSDSLIKFYEKYKIPYMLDYIRATNEWLKYSGTKKKLEQQDDKTHNQLKQFTSKSNQYEIKLRQFGISTAPRFRQNSHLNLAWNLFNPVVAQLMKKYRLVDSDLPKTLDERKF